MSAICRVVGHLSFTRILFAPTNFATPSLGGEFHALPHLVILLLCRCFLIHLLGLILLPNPNPNGLLLLLLRLGIICSTCRPRLPTISIPSVYTLHFPYLFFNLLIFIVSCIYLSNAMNSGAIRLNVWCFVHSLVSVKPYYYINCFEFQSQLAL